MDADRDGGGRARRGLSAPAAPARGRGARWRGPAVLALALLAGLCGIAPAGALAQRPLPTVRPPDAIDRAHGLATRPLPGVPPAPRVDERWVPERRFYSPRLGRDVVVPGHFEQRITDQQYRVPPLNAITRPDGRQIPIPSGEHPPAEIRSAP